jgi:hypothetical protein
LGKKKAYEEINDGKALSAAARRKIAAALRARWAKQRKIGRTTA